MAPGEAIRDLMVERGMDNERLSEALGWPQSSVAALLAGRRQLDMTSARLLAETLGFTADYWLGLYREYRRKSA